MNTLSLIVAALSFGVFGACRQEPGGIAGKWVGQIVSDSPMPDGMMKFDLEFLADKTFKGSLHTTGMMTVDAKMSGKYKIVNDVATLSGKSEVYMDDGYKKETNTEDFEMKLKVESDRLTVIDQDGGGDKLIFRREGASKLAAANQKPVNKQLGAQSDPKAIAFLKNVENKYKSLETYSDDGTIKSNGDGFSAKDARFKIRHAKDGRFLFRVDLLGEGKVYESEGVTSRGGKTILHMEEGSEERTLGNALSILQVQSREAAGIVPSLLMPKEMKRSYFEGLKSVAFLKGETIDGHACRVVESKSAGGSLRIWIDDKSLLILKTHSSVNGGTTLFHPKTNTKIPDKEFDYK
jgi:outer membrane lipoprotein-sorting protein